GPPPGPGRRGGPGASGGPAGWDAGGGGPGPAGGNASGAGRHLPGSGPARGPAGLGGKGGPSMSILVNRETRVLVQGITGREGRFHTAQMKAYGTQVVGGVRAGKGGQEVEGVPVFDSVRQARAETRSEEHTSELQSRENLVCRLLLEKKKKT